MPNDNDSKAKILCHKAKEMLKMQPPGSALHFSEGEILRLIHELEVHQNELEMQNEELLLANEKAEQQNELLNESLFHANQTVMLLIDPKTGEIKDANPAACKYYGWSHRLLCSRNID